MLKGLQKQVKKLFDSDTVDIPKTENVVEGNLKFDRKAVKLLILYGNLYDENSILACLPKEMIYEILSYLSIQINYDKPPVFLFSFGNSESIGWPYSLVTDGEGDIFIVYRAGAELSVYNREGKFKYKFESIVNACGMAINLDLKRLYLADDTHKEIRVHDLSGKLLFKFGKGKLGNLLRGLGIDNSGRVLVCDSGKHRMMIFSADGEFLFSFGSVGNGDGHFNTPFDAKADSQNNIYVVEYGNDRCSVFDTTGKFLRNFGKPGNAFGEFNSPQGIAIFDELVIIDDFRNHRVQAFGPDGKFKWSLGDHGSNPGDFLEPRQVNIDKEGKRLYVIDTNHRVSVFTWLDETWPPEK